MLWRKFRGFIVFPRYSKIGVSSIRGKIRWFKMLSEKFLWLCILSSSTGNCAIAQRRRLDMISECECFEINHNYLCSNLFVCTSENFGYIRNSRSICKYDDVTFGSIRSHGDPNHDAHRGLPARTHRTMDRLDWSPWKKNKRKTAREPYPWPFSFHVFCTLTIWAILLHTSGW